MGIYPAFLMTCALVGALCAGFILAQSPDRRATQLAALIGLAGAWWALCEALWNVAPTASAARFWMQLSAPGWAFIPGLLPHLTGRYFDEYPLVSVDGMRRALRWAAGFGYGAGVAIVALTWLGIGVHGPIERVPWGWTYAPGPAQIAFIVAIGAPVTLALVAVGRAFRSPMSVAPKAHRMAVRIGIWIPLVLVGVTETTLPIAGVHFPRLGSAAYTLFGLVALGTGLRFGLSFFTPNRFSEEILETLHEGVAMIGPTGAVRRANQGFGLLAGRDPRSLVGMPLRDLLRWQPPFDEATPDEVATELIDAHGAPVPVSATSAPLRDQADNPIGVVVVLRDMREIEDLRRAMLTQARLAAVGELAAGLAHEINNPLAFVRANLSQLQRYWDQVCAGSIAGEELETIAQDGREMLEESLVGTDRAAEIVRGVRRFTHAGFASRELADLNALVEDTLAMLRAQARSARIDFEPGSIPSVPCEPQQMRGVFLNLINNAVQAVDEHGRVRVVTQSEGDDVVVEVSDSGCGMEAATLDRIFDPFFTTKQVGEGTGLGLAIAWHVVAAHGGRIEVRSAPGTGSCFRVRLPVKDPDESGSPAG